MRVLMLAPQPFFEPRGAPFCVHQHVRALVKQGHEVDLVTYPYGEDVDLPGLRIYRTPSVPFVRNVKPGFSLAKFPLDLLVFLTAFWRLCLGRYRLLYTHEEAALMGVVLAALFGCKHLYTMHCDLAQLMGENAFITTCVRAVQAFMLRKADAVIVLYPELALLVKRVTPFQRVYTLLPSAVDEGLPPATEEDAECLRRQWSLGAGPILLYTGTLEEYQGLDLLLRSAAIVRATLSEVRYVIVGGKPAQIMRLTRLACELGIGDIVLFTGQRSLAEMPQFMALADVLVSPRSKGTHVPLKIYTYLRSGKAILATDILSHTQVLTPAVALLVPPTPAALAQGTLELLQNPALAERLGRRSQSFAQEHYSWSAFLAKSRCIYQDFLS
jgi:glycosyltransferase involved in cell wall biosynthesis